MKSSEGRTYIQELAQALRELQLAQDKVNAVIDRIREQENTAATTRREIDQQPGRQEIATLPVAKVIEDTEAIPGTGLRIGDRVRIINSGKDQEDRGIITGYKETRTYTWIIVTPRTGPPIRRVARNLRKL